MGPVVVFVLAIASQAPLDRAEVEALLATARIVSHQDVPVGVTRPLKLELSDGERTLSASWKNVDILRPGITRFADGTFERNFSDNYRYEIAAYELDKLLGTDLVPPTIERRFRGEAGALTLWIEGATTDFDRRQKNIAPPDLLRWNRQVYNVQLFRFLTFDADYKNARNVLIDPEWHLWAIDSSRAFRIDETLIDDSLDHFSRAVLAKLESLDFETLKAHLGKWVSDDRLRALLVRRDLIVKRARELAAERGEGAVLVP
jgi:hypothetical protein